MKHALNERDLIEWRLQDPAACDLLCMWLRELTRMRRSAAIVGVELGEGQVTVECHDQCPEHEWLAWHRLTVPVSKLPPAWPGLLH